MTHYKVYRDQGLVGSGISVALGDFNGTAGTMAGLSSGRSYRFQVSAVSAVGEGLRSEHVTQSTAPGKPAAPIVVGQSSNAISLSWNTPNVTTGSSVTSFKLYRFENSSVLYPHVTADLQWVRL